jgi:hypothetical protein
MALGADAVGANNSWRAIADANLTAHMKKFGLFAAAYAAFIGILLAIPIASVIYMVPNHDAQLDQWLLQIWATLTALSIAAGALVYLSVMASRKLYAQRDNIRETQVSEQVADQESAEHDVTSVLTDRSNVIPHEKLFARRLAKVLRVRRPRSKDEDSNVIALAR